jgi:hypothetical protein
VDNLYTTNTDDGWEARIASFKGVGKGDTELDAVKSLARALRNKLEEARDVLMGGD